MEASNRNKVLGWIGVPLFAYAMWNGYLDVRPGDAFTASYCAVLAILAALPPFFVRSPTLRVWAGVNLALAAFFDLGMMTDALQHDAYSGTAAILFAPIGLALLASLFAIALVVQLRATSPRQGS